MTLLSEVNSGQVNPDWIRGKIVLIGMMSVSAKDLASSGAIAGINPGRIYGVEMQAHATSQILSAVLDGRPLLRVWTEGWEILWIVAWGLLGTIVPQLLRSPRTILCGLGVVTISPIAIGCGLILLGWWVPIVPVLAILVLNGTGSIATLFYRHQQELQLRLEERQFAIEQIFNAIHSGPLQTLVGMLRSAGEQELPPSYLSDLQRLNRELREVYGSIQREASLEEPNLRGGSSIELGLQAPLHELLYKVYDDTLQHDLPYLQTLRCKIVQFDFLNAENLRWEHKRGLCRFLEEAIRNVGKHAIDATRLTVICTQEGDRLVIRVEDNGSAETPTATETNCNSEAIADGTVQISNSGLGTQLANNLAKQLGGTFRRYPNRSRGMVCELTWPVKRRWLF